MVYAQHPLIPPSCIKYWSRQDARKTNPIATLNYVTSFSYISILPNFYFISCASNSSLNSLDYSNMVNWLHVRIFLSLTLFCHAGVSPLSSLSPLSFGEQAHKLEQHAYTQIRRLKRLKHTAITIRASQPSVAARQSYENVWRLSLGSTPLTSQLQYSPLKMLYKKKKWRTLVYLLFGYYIAAICNFGISCNLQCKKDVYN